jgi:hypothetical protein
MIGKNTHLLKNSVDNTFCENEWENSSNLSHKWRVFSGLQGALPDWSVTQEEAGPPQFG